ncbi:uncharacterized protein LOC133173202 [Saccostrea echinata]|uniref:uncharacterized protein LOC133173202 n=1 Tax=Saccostrea echinata TaxID=191078 RepID=UPI002A83DDF7|nr:uncharacterized protein LOC133173202 [Saccostrea echinata]
MMGTLPQQDIYVDRDGGETGRYYVTLESGNKYSCHYGDANPNLIDSPAFSEECYNQNKHVLTDIENNTGQFPYYRSANLTRSPGCGPLPNVTSGTGEWVCPKGVSLSSVPVYVSCLFQCLNGTTNIKVRCTEKLKWDNNLSGVCSSDALSDKNFDPPSTNLPLAIIMPIMACLLLIFFLVLFITKRRLNIKCANLKKKLCNSSDTDNNFNDTESPSVLGCEKKPRSQKCPVKNQIANRTHDVQQQKDASGRKDLDSNTSQESHRMSDSSNNDLLQTMNSETSSRFSDFCNYNGGTNTSYPQNEWREDSEDLPPPSSFSTSNDISIPLEIDSLKCEYLGITKENVAYLKCPSQKASVIKPDPCPTVAAMLDGALENSVQFVDDLSTLLDPDKQYKNICTWQGLAQKLFDLPYNKILEIRHKTKDHFKEGVLPLLSSHGCTIYDVTSYFNLESSRRVDVIECIRRYHPNCQKCGEIYNNLKPDMLSKLS